MMKATSAPPESFGGSLNRRNTLDFYAFAGLQQRFLSVFNTPTVWTTSTDKIKAIEKLFPPKKNAELQITYPYAFLIVKSWQKSLDRGNLRAASLRGTRVSISSDTMKTEQARFLPVDFTISVEWTTNSFEDITDIGRRWLFLQQRGHLNFTVEFGQSVFPIKVVPDDNITFPQREADPDNVQEYSMETSLIMQAYISEPELVQQDVVEAVEVTGYVGKEEAESVIWKFQTPKLP